MNRLATLLLLVALIGFACAPISRETPSLLKGHLVLEVDPNPLIAKHLGGDDYEVPFDIVMREEGGVDLRVEDFTIDAIAFHTVVVQSQTFPGSAIEQRGYPSQIGAGKYLRFSFTKRWTLPTRLLLSGASARITAHTIDTRGQRDTSKLTVGIRVSD